MTDAARSRRPVIHLGFDGTGGAELARLFRHNGLPVLCWDAGDAARDIAWRAAAGRAPRPEWRDLALLTELHWHSGALRPPVEAFRDIGWFDRHFPGALFLLTTRDVDAWLTARLAARDMKRSARMAALHRDIPVADLADLWAADWHAHVDAVRARFGGRDDYLEIDVESLDWPALRARLAPHVPGLHRDVAAGGSVLAPPADADAGRVMALLSDARPPAPRRHGRADPAVIDRLIAHCLDGVGPASPAAARVAAAGAPDGVSPLYAWHDGAGRALRRRGLPWPLAAQGGDPAQVHAAPEPKSERVERVIADLLALAPGKPVQTDMQDGRRLGLPGGPDLGHPLLVYNRRAGARNLALWPLPGFHSLGSPEFALPETPDRTAFAAKRDMLVWRGSLSGNARPASGGIGHPARRLLDDGGDAALADLATIPRLATLRRYAGRADMDLGLVLARALAGHARHPLIAPHLRPRLSVGQMLQCRYQLCLAGFDVGTNFIWAANSHAVVLKEEAGWEVYYSALFTPWDHYIPVAEGCADLPDKLDWARANPAACMAMSAAARAVVAQLSGRAGQREMMRAVTDALPPAPPPVPAP